MQKRAVRTKSAAPKVEAGSTNVFADLGFPNAGEMKVKAELARYINSVLSQRGYTQVEAAKILRVHQPKVSDLKRGRLSDFSIETLLRYQRVILN
jgi:predicted XRE-type DNA-binding protein